MATTNVTKMRAKTLSYIPVIEECIKDSSSMWAGIKKASKKLNISENVLSTHWNNYKKSMAKDTPIAKQKAIGKQFIIQETLLHVKNGSIILKSGIEIKGDFILQL